MRELALSEIENVSGGETHEHGVPITGPSGQTGTGTRVTGTRPNGDPFVVSITNDMALSAGYAHIGDYLSALGGGILSGDLGPVLHTALNDVDDCGLSDFGPCQLPSGNYVIDGIVVGETTLSGPEVDWVGVGTDLIQIGTGAVGGAGIANIGLAALIPIGSGAATIDELRDPGGDS